MSNESSKEDEKLKRMVEIQGRDLPTFVLPNCVGDGTFFLYKDIWLPRSGCTLEDLEGLEEFEFHDSILVASFPKSGTTWVQEIVSQIEMLHREDGEAWKSIKVNQRFSFLEYSYPEFEKRSLLKSSRFFKTHLAYQALPTSIIRGARIIYIARDPKDVCVSFFHFFKTMTVYLFKGSFMEYFDHFISGKIGWGPWEKNVLSYWEKRNDKNVLFITYEGIHQNPQEAIRKISDFIGKPVTKDQIEAIAENTKFDKMKDDSSTNYAWWEEIGVSKSPFFRKGKVGDWKNYMDESMLKRVEVLFEKNPSLHEIFH